MDLLKDLKIAGELALRYGPLVLAELPGIPSELAGPVAAAIKDSLGLASDADKKTEILAVASDTLAGVSALKGISPGQQQSILASVGDAVDTTLQVITSIHALRTGTVTPAVPAAPVVGQVKPVGTVAGDTGSTGAAGAKGTIQ